MLLPGLPLPLASSRGVGGATTRWKGKIDRPVRIPADCRLYSSQGRSVAFTGAASEDTTVVGASVGDGKLVLVGMSAGTATVHAQYESTESSFTIVVTP